MVGRPDPVLVDTTSLVAFCKTDYDEFLFRRLAMSTTNVCNEEVKRQEGVSDRYEHRMACDRYLQLAAQENNPDTIYVEAYEPYVEDQGERSLETVFRAHPDAVEYVLLFDFDAIESFERLRHELGSAARNTRTSLPNHAFELLRREDVVTTEEYCQATYQLGVAEGWLKRHAQRFDSVSPVDCEEFP